MSKYRKDDDNSPIRWIGNSLLIIFLIGVSLVLSALPSLSLMTNPLSSFQKGMTSFASSPARFIEESARRTMTAIHVAVKFSNDSYIFKSLASLPQAGFDDPEPEALEEDFGRQVVVSGTNLSRIYVLQNTAAAPFLSVGLRVNRGKADFSGLRVDRIGTISDEEIGDVRLYSDLNGDGRINTEKDRLLAKGRFSLKSVTFEFPPVSIGERPSQFIITLGIKKGARNGRTAGVMVSNAGYVAVLASHEVEPFWRFKSVLARVKSSGSREAYRLWERSVNYRKQGRFEKSYKTLGSAKSLPGYAAQAARELSRLAEVRRALSQDWRRKNLPLEYRGGINAYVNGNIGKAILLLNSSLGGLEHKNGHLKRFVRRVARQNNVDFSEKDRVPLDQLLRRKLSLAEDALLKGDLTGALRFCRQAVVLDEESAVSHARLGTVNYVMGVRHEAFSSWEKALRLDPQYEELKMHIYKAKRRL